MSSRVYYMEGYLAASPTGLQAALQGRQIARDAGLKLATTLSDVSMINFCRGGLAAMVGEQLDYLFCNELEAKAWCGTQDPSVIYREISQLARTVCLTRGAQGCVLLERHQQTSVAADVVKAVDTNGAGDMFAGSFLYAVTHGYSHIDAARLANQAAGQVVRQYGNRLTRNRTLAIKAHFEQNTSS